MQQKENIVSIGKAKLYYEFINKHLLSEGKPLLVFLHEGLGCIEQWKNFPELLCKQTNCPALLFDREGHGKSSMLLHKRSINFMHEQAYSVLPEIFIKLNLNNYNKILIGHSDGGSIAIIHAGSFPQKIKGIITEAAHIFSEDITLKGINEAVNSFENRKLKELLRKYHGDNTDSMFYGWADTWLKKEFKEWNIEEYLKKINIPFLAIQGKDDTYGSEEQLKLIKKHIPCSQIEFITQCGHIPHIQAQEKILKIINGFISKL